MRFKKKNVKFQLKGTTLVRTLNVNFFELTLIVKTLNPGRFGSINEFHMLVRESKLCSEVDQSKYLDLWLS